MTRLTKSERPLFHQKFVQDYGHSLLRLKENLSAYTLKTLPVSESCLLLMYALCSLHKLSTLTLNLLLFISALIRKPLLLILRPSQ